MTRTAVAFRRRCDGLSALMPERVARVVTGRVIGYAMVNSVTFAVDLAVVTALRTLVGWPVPAAFTVGYGVALTLNFLLQRWLNFPSPGHVGAQAVRYVIAVALNFALIVLLLGSGLTAAGVPYQLARIAAAGGEAVFLYCALRWFVFRPRPVR